MDESKEFIPSLTLDPNAASASAVAAELGVDEPKAPVLEEKKDVPVEKLELERLSPAEQAAVKEFAKQIDVTNSEQVPRKRTLRTSPTPRSARCAPRTSVRWARSSLTSLSSFRA
jgi:hypothetical protein